MSETIPAEQPPIDLPGPEQVAKMVTTWAAVSPPFAAALQGGTATAAALGRLGLGLFRANQWAEAVDVFRAAAALEPGNHLFWLNLAVGLDRSGSPARAIPCVERSVALARQQPAAWLLLGSLKSKLSDLSGAETAYRTALELDAASSVAWQCLGLVKQEQGALTEAIDCFLACVTHGGGTAGVLANLGKLYYQTGRLPQAVEVYAVALQQDPANANYLHAWREVRFLRDVSAGGSVDEALAVFQQSLPAGGPPTDQDLLSLLQTAFLGLRTFRQHEAAVRVGRKWLELAPDKTSAEYLLRAVEGNTGLDQSPRRYIVEQFDNLAEQFDEKLVKTLRYDIPAQLCSALQRFVEPDRLLDTADLGCGTGLCGPLLRPLSRQLIGVDLSPKMLEQARQRGVYDDLHCEELVGFLQRSTGRFDLLVAADVLIYLGDLDHLWAAAGQALRPGALLAFSIESLPGEGYRLQTTGRFAHSRAYVRALSEPLFEERACFATPIRLEALQPIPGHCFVLARR